MRSAYHDQLDQFDEALVHMTKLVNAAMIEATNALLDADLVAAESVIAGDEAIDAVAHDMEEQALQLVALQAPVATDLRVCCCQACASRRPLNVWATSRYTSRRPLECDTRERCSHRTAIGHHRDGRRGRTDRPAHGRGLATRDIDAAIGLAVIDDDMDFLHRQLFHAVLSEDWQHGVEAAIDVTLVSRYYERFADHAVTIGKRVVHIVTGEPYSTAGVE